MRSAISRNKLHRKTLFNKLIRNVMKYPDKQIICSAVKIFVIILLPVIIVCRFSLAAPAGKNIEPAEKNLLVKEGDSLMKTRNLNGYKEACVK